MANEDIEVVNIDALQGDLKDYLASSGAFVKSDQGKARFDLIPPEYLFKIALVMGHGAEKYGDNNWAQGADWSRYFAAAQRHLWAWFNGEDVDAESGQSHLAHAACCLAFLVSYQHRGLGKDNRFHKVYPHAN